MARKKRSDTIYEEGNMAARKSTGPSCLVHAGKMREISWNSAEGNTDISKCVGLLGRYMPVEVDGENGKIKKNARIVMLYPHMVRTEYVHNNHTFTTCFSTAELVSLGMLSFATGKPEVIE